MAQEFILGVNCLCVPLPNRLLQVLLVALILSCGTDDVSVGRRFCTGEVHCTSPASSEAEALVQTRVLRFSKNKPQPSRSCPPKFLKVGRGECFDGENRAGHLGWAACVCNKAVGDDCAPEGAHCPSLDVCESECAALGNCGGFNWSRGRCWLFKKINLPSVSSNPENTSGYDCYVKDMNVSCANLTTAVATSTTSTRSTTDIATTTHAMSVATTSARFQGDATNLSTTSPVTYCSNKFTKIGRGACVDGESEAGHLGWAKCVCNKEVGSSCTREGSHCPNVNICKTECDTLKDCGGFNWSPRRCWLLKKMTSPEVPSNPTLRWFMYECYVKQSTCVNSTEATGTKNSSMAQTTRVSTAVAHTTSWQEAREAEAHSL